EAERAKTVPAGALDGRKLRARHPQRRMRFLNGFRHHVAQGNIEMLAVVFAAALLEHRKDRANGFLEHFLLGFHVAAERRQLGDRGALAHPEFAASLAEEIEHCDALGDARRMIGGKLANAVTEPDVFGALAGGGEKGFRRRRMRIFFQKMMFNYPGIVVAEPVGGFELRQRVLIKLQLIAGWPRARQLQLIKDAEFHVVAPRAGLLLSAVYSRGRMSPVSDLFRWTGEALCWTHEWLV